MKAVDLSYQDQRTEYKQCIFCGCDWFKVYPAEGKKICMMCGVDQLQK